MTRLQREARRVAHLNHPSIVPIYEVGVETSREQSHNYFTMQLMTGGSLADRLQSGPIEPKHAVSILAEVARGLHFAHQHGIIHRDVKPGNILFDERGSAYIADFGLARHFDVPNCDSIQSRWGSLASDNAANNRSHAALAGTPMYMAPEQVDRQRELTTATDVYGLGAVMYEMLTGQPPYQAATGYQTLIDVVRAHPKPPRELRSALHRDLEVICLKCLAKQPEDRYGSTEALADDLNRWLRNEPILARRYLPWERMTKWVQRSPALSAVSAVALLAVSFSIISLWQSKEAIRREQVQTQDAMDAQTATLDELTRTRAREQRMAYLQSIALAEREWSAGTASAAQVLSESPKRLRGWEWHYVQHRMNSSTAAFDLPFEACCMARHPTKDVVYVGGGNTGWDGHVITIDDSLTRLPGDGCTRMPSPVWRFPAMVGCW